MKKRQYKTITLNKHKWNKHKVLEWNTKMNGEIIKTEKEIINKIK